MIGYVQTTIHDRAMVFRPDLYLVSKRNPPLKFGESWVNGFEVSRMIAYAPVE